MAQREWMNIDFSCSFPVKKNMRQAQDREKEIIGVCAA